MTVMDLLEMDLYVTLRVTVLGGGFIWIFMALAERFLRKRQTSGGVTRNHVYWMGVLLMSQIQFALDYVFYH
ncbi:hypothetical protein [Varunaivibrio sulfuroxidans]|uniref:Uncharacterized protein n=1 Tax=Varunaivibrio sulfuroxidans TaxID=1773489 RepID=A0A4R3J8G6_9PROT|nr:hypothetical protein [Varunaivibrio sulfuroxidans]TCS61213.1 hypothetical protein EDD55_10811 [Varunaivibrio sulfuroxidans]WES31166.1 hypothetical protein P3M64_01960 [Varunaivibrio sulfuroxidans]